MTATLQILISTCNDRLLSIPKMLLEPRPDVGYIVVHQQFSNVSEDLSQVVSILQKRKDVLLKSSDSRGLSVSRNIALSLATAPYLLIADDDISFTRDAFASIIKIMTERPGVAAMTFCFRDGAGQHIKQYPEKEILRSWSNIFQVSSIEVCLRLSFIREHCLEFDTRFGLGAEFPVSEENILLSDILRSGGEVRFFPLDIAVHPEETSGGNWNEKYLKARGALFRRVFGLKGGLLLFLFFMKHKSVISKEFRSLSALRIMYNAFFKF